VPRGARGVQGWVFWLIGLTNGFDGAPVRWCADCLQQRALSPWWCYASKLDSRWGSAAGDVGDFSNEFFEHVFEGDDAADGSVFVDDACEVGAAAA
jgi:hypothetical protein